MGSKAGLALQLAFMIHVFLGQSRHRLLSSTRELPQRAGIVPHGGSKVEVNVDVDL